MLFWEGGWVGEREERGSVLRDSETLNYSPETRLQGEGGGEEREGPTSRKSCL